MRPALDIPEGVERLLAACVSQSLRAELERRGLLLTEDQWLAADRETNRRGARCLANVIARCYPSGENGAGRVAVEFGSAAAAQGIRGALAFGATTARLLSSGGGRDGAELLGALFNLGIGMIDGLCDGSPEAGVAVLETLSECDLRSAVEGPRPRGWLRCGVPAPLGQDAAVAFLVAVVEVFFETLHATYPGPDWSRLRGRVGAQLNEALHAERRSVVHTHGEQDLLECSRGTSVLPFEVIETLAAGSQGRATLLGEAMWRIDDLVDLCADARGGALNGVLLRAARSANARLPAADDVTATLERLATSDQIASVAAAAADDLQQALRDSRGAPSWEFLYFVAEYAGLSPRSSNAR